MVLGACLLITAPLECLGTGVYRRPRRLIAAVAPVFLVFVIWDFVAAANDIWWYNPKFITGWTVPGGLPVEEVLFFLVIPICGLLTYSAVDGLLAVPQRRMGRTREAVRR